MKQLLSEYEVNAQQFCERHQLEFRSVLIGSDCPLFCADADKQFKMDEVEKYPRKSHIHGKHYRCTFSRKDKGHFSVDFWNSYADEEYLALGNEKYRHGEQLFKWDRRITERDGRQIAVNDTRKIQPYDVLTCITKNDPGTFEDFCSEYGYDEDSRKAESVYHAVQKEWSKVQRFFTAEEVQELQEIQ